MQQSPVLEIVLGYSVDTSNPQLLLVIKVTETSGDKYTRDFKDVIQKTGCQMFHYCFIVITCLNDKILDILN